MKKLYALCISFLLLFSIVPAIAADEYPQYILDAQAAIEQAQQEIADAQEEDIDTANAEGFLGKVGIMLSDAIAAYEEGDLETAEETASWVVELSLEISQYFPEEDEDEDDEITDTLSDYPWRILRLLQLQKTLDYTARASQAVKEYIEDHDGETEGLDDIIQEMDDLLERAQNVDVDSENFQDEFVSILKGARKNIKAFKSLTRPELRIIGEHKDLKKELRNIKRDVRDEYKEKIAEAREDIKRFRVLKFFERIGFEDEELIEQIQNKEISAKEALAAFKQDYKKFSRKDKKAFRETVGENIKESFNNRAGGRR